MKKNRRFFMIDFMVDDPEELVINRNSKEKLSEVLSLDI